MLNRLLAWFVLAWTALVVAVDLAAVSGALRFADTFGPDWAWLDKFYGPFNAMNWVALVILLLPAAVALWWRGRRRMADSVHPE